MKKILTNKYLILVFLIGLFYLGKNLLDNRKLSELTINNATFKIEKAESFAEKGLGLMYRRTLKPDRGMLFIYPEETYTSFWMKNTYIPLDMIWIDKDKKIIDITYDAQPCTLADCPSYKTDNKIQYVLEVNAGTAEKYGFKEGNQVNF